MFLINFVLSEKKFQQLLFAIMNIKQKQGNFILNIFFFLKKHFLDYFFVQGH